MPADVKDQLRPFEAKVGSAVAMDGRLWHTSGANITAGEERALLFGYYSKAFLRPQVNWNTPRGLADDVAAILTDLHAPGRLIALPDGFEHVLAFYPAPGVQLRRVCLLASDISRELDVAYVHIEQMGAAAELRARLLREVPCNS